MNDIYKTLMELRRDAIANGQSELADIYGRSIVRLREQILREQYLERRNSSE